MNNEKVHTSRENAPDIKTQNRINETNTDAPTPNATYQDAKHVDQDEGMVGLGLRLRLLLGIRGVGH